MLTFWDISCPPTFTKTKNFDVDGEGACALAYGAANSAIKATKPHTFLIWAIKLLVFSWRSIFMGKRLQKPAQMVARRSEIDYHSRHTLLDSFTQGATFLTHGRTYVAAGLSVIIALSIACGRTAS